MPVTLAEISDTLNGISLSLSADAILFGTNTSARDYLIEMIGKMKKSEARNRGVSADEVFSELPPDHALHPDTEAIWTQYLTKLDATINGSSDNAQIDTNHPQAIEAPITIRSFRTLIRNNALLLKIFEEGNPENGIAKDEKHIAQFNTLTSALDSIASHETHIRNTKKFDIATCDQSILLDGGSIVIWNRAINQVLELEKEIEE